VAGSKRGIGLQACGSQVAILQFRRGFEMKYWEMIAEKLSARGLSWGCSSQIDSSGHELFTVDGYSRDGRRFIILSDEKPTAFIELESAIRWQEQQSLHVGYTSQDACI
jgi:hypothetical protein